jgi:small nuclear ribonucleoprotein (snRNP)-like protein
MAPPSRGSVNGLPHRKLDRESSGRHDNKTNLVRSSSGGLSGAENGIKIGHASHSKDRLIYVLAQLIGHHVDVHVKNGSIISGIFHATNSDKDFGVVLKMAQVIKDGSARGQRYGADVVKKPETMIIPARELVQVFAKVSFSFSFYGLWFANFSLVPSIIIICLISVGIFDVFIG